MSKVMTIRLRLTDSLLNLQAIAYPGINFQNALDILPSLVLYSQETKQIEGNGAKTNTT